MLETVFKLARGNVNAIEKVVFDENIHYIHLILAQDEGLPVHNANANIYMTVLRGCLTISLDDQDAHRYEGSTLIKFPKGTKMNVRNLDSEALELIIVKAPVPEI